MKQAWKVYKGYPCNIFCNIKDTTLSVMHSDNLIEKVLVFDWFILFLSVWVLACMYVCTYMHHLCCLVPTKGTRSPGTKDLELLIVVSHHVGSGPRPPARATTLLTTESSFLPKNLYFHLQSTTQKKKTIEFRRTCLGMLIPNQCS